MPPLRLDPDRLLPSDTATRDIARAIHAATEAAPIVSPHGHVDARLLAEDVPFTDPTSLLISPDHYVTRLLHADGVPLDTLGVGEPLGDETARRRAWRALCSRWEMLAGTVVRTWLEHQLVELFGVEDVPNAGNADDSYDRIAARLAGDDFRPRALWERFGIDVLATTDDPCDDLTAHAVLDADPTWTGRVVPTFRPDRYLEPVRADWPGLVQRIGTAADVDTSTYDGFVVALETRRRFFIDHGATATDHSHADLESEPLSHADAFRIHADALRGEATAAEMVAYRRHLFAEMARMSCDDGLVMMVHPGIVRNHHRPTFERFGQDTGHDLPRRIDFVEPLRPLLERYGTHPGFHLVLFTVDPTAWAREIAPLAGFYPSVYAGVPWWFGDSPAGMERFWDGIVDQIGFTRTSGFIDDTRAYLSIPTRHDVARRIEAGVLARLVVAGRIDVEEATRIAGWLVGDQPRAVFKL